MKIKLLGLALLVVAIYAQQATAQIKLDPIWATDTVFNIPESVLPINGQDLMLVSNLVTGSTGKDGDGYISKIDRKGKMLEQKWVTGLSAPKGMALYNNKLYVADINEVVVIDFITGTIIRRLSIPNAIFLNDVSANERGAIFISDSRTNKIHALVNGEIITYLEGLNNPNGLLCQPEGLYFLNRGNLMLRNNKGGLVQIATGMEPSTDGIERVNGTDFIISAWIGVVYHVSIQGVVTQLLDLRPEKANTADIGYDDKSKMVYIPTFNKNTVVAYKLILP